MVGETEGAEESPHVGMNGISLLAMNIRQGKEGNEKPTQYCMNRQECANI